MNTIEFSISHDMLGSKGFNIDSNTTPKLSWKLYFYKNRYKISLLNIIKTEKEEKESKIPVLIPGIIKQNIPSKFSYFS